MANRNSGGSTGADGTSDTLTMDDATHLLSSYRRRFVIDVLTENASITRSKLSDEVAALENNISVSEVTGKQRKRTHTSNRQTHLEKLEDAGILNVGDREPIERGPTFDNAVEILQTLRDLCEDTK
ncbi:DUF7344 domain-containing protein [Natronorubrum daqingense]|nr:hypothetical protein SAMN05421809_3753 [Natronorubrum daqingense]